MMVMTAKVDLKKIIIGLIAAAAVILVLILLLGGRRNAAPTAAAATISVSSNDDRVQLLKGMGWEVSTSPKESGQVRIPKEAAELFDRYNGLQKSQGFDLSQYAGKTVMRYVYQVNNYPGATQPVYATLLVYKNQVIGGDITDTAPGGQIRPLKKADTTVPETTLPQSAAKEAQPSPES